MSENKLFVIVIVIVIVMVLVALVCLCVCEQRYSKSYKRVVGLVV